MPTRKNGTKPAADDEWVPMWPVCQGDVHTWNWRKARRVNLHSTVWWGRWLKCRECPTKKLQTIHRQTGKVIDTDYVWPDGYRVKPGQTKPPKAEIRADQMAAIPEIDDPMEVWKLPPTKSVSRGPVKRDRRPQPQKGSLA